MRHNVLYYHIPTYNTLKSKQTSLLLNHSLESVDENKMFYTNRQVQRAKLARQIYHAIGTPSVNDFKMIVTSNMIRNLPINMDDIKIAENIFGITDCITQSEKPNKTQHEPSFYFPFLFILNMNENLFCVL